MMDFNNNHGMAFSWNLILVFKAGFQFTDRVYLLGGIFHDHQLHNVRLDEKFISDVMIIHWFIMFSGDKCGSGGRGLK